MSSTQTSTNPKLTILQSQASENHYEVAFYENFDKKEGNLKIDFSEKMGYLLYSIILALTALLSILFMIFTIGVALKKTHETPLLLVLLNGAFSLMGYFIYQTWTAMSSNDLIRAGFGRDGFVFSLISSTMYFLIIFLCSDDESIIVLLIVNLGLHLFFIVGATEVIKVLEAEEKHKRKACNNFENKL